MRFVRKGVDAQGLFHKGFIKSAFNVPKTLLGRPPVVRELPAVSLPRLSSHENSEAALRRARKKYKIP
jgi:hypothetical protein